MAREQIESTLAHEQIEQLGENAEIRGWKNEAEDEPGGFGFGLLQLKFNTEITVVRIYNSI